MAAEQKIKQRLFALLGAVLYFTFLTPFLYVTWGITVSNLELTLINWERVIRIAVNTLIISFVILRIVLKKAGNFLAIEKTMYKVNIENLGGLYLIKMLDQEVFICSKDASLDLDNLSEETYLIKRMI